MLAKSLYNYFKAAYPLICITTHEEERVCKEIYLLQKEKEGLKIYEWDALNGLTLQQTANGKKTTTYVEKSKSWQEVILCIEKFDTERNIFILKDFHAYLSDTQAGVIRQLRNALVRLKALGNMIVFVSPAFKFPMELAREIQYLPYDLPDEAYISGRIDFMKSSYENDLDGVELALTPETRGAIIGALKGMSHSEIDNALALGLVQLQAFNSEFVQVVHNEKVEKIRNNGLLQHIQTNLSFDDVGGLDGIKRWMYVRSKSFTPEARAFKLPFAKGVMLCGYPGTGKSMIAKAIASELNAPLFSLDVGGLFGSKVGDTEKNFREVIKILEAIGPCVLLIDEIEKSLNRDAVSGKGDSGTSSRSFGSLLTWFSDRESPVFVVATSNDHTRLPPELTRKGRFDELFWIDLPTEEDRVSIFSVLLKRYERDPDKFDLAKLAAKTKGFVGSEIDEMIKSALFNVFASGEDDIDTTDIVDEIEASEPLSKTNADYFEEMRDKAKGKLRDASSVAETLDLKNGSRKFGIA